MSHAAIRTLGLLGALGAACSSPQDLSYLEELVDAGAEPLAPPDAALREPAPCASWGAPPGAILGGVCSAGIGACERAGQYACMSGVLVCSAVPGIAGPELCDTERDEDCDGSVDEGPEDGCCTDADCEGVEVCKRPTDDAFAPGACAWPGDPNADCERQDTEVVCSCKRGYDGDGQRCERDYCEPLEEDEPEPCGDHESCKSEEDGPRCTCEPSFDDCDGESKNGCEVDLTSAAEHCGACGLACAEVLECEDGDCGAYVDTIVLGYSAGYALTPSGRVLGSGYAELLQGKSATATAFGALSLEDATDISVNVNHACVLREGGHASCGGLSSSGITIGGDESSETKVDIALTGIRAIAAGEAHSCLVNDDGHVYCWGQGTLGQFGDGQPRSGEAATRTLATALEDELRVSYVSDAVDVQAGRSISCALTEQARVYCWGAHDGTVYAPELVGKDADELLEDVEVLCTGTAHACALRSDKTVVCWGSDQHGQLGSDDSPPGHSRYVEVEIEGVVSLACGYGHSCAVLDNGEAYCWGSGAQGQLGTGTAGNRDSPSLVSLPGLPAARSVHAGSGAMSSCVELSSGDVYCFGFNYYGQLGLGAESQVSTVFAPSLVRDWP